jgi:hypothetical protein
MEFVGKYIIYFHPQLNIPRYNNSLAVAAKRKLNETIRQLKTGYGSAATRSEMDEFGRKNFRSL